MVKAPTPPNEDARLKDLQSFEILDTENEKDYDGLVELVSQICECPIAIVNFIDSNRQWFKACKNMNSKEANREDSFCGHAIMKSEVLIVSDATRDERFFDNPEVTGGLEVRFYAGAPIVSPNGYKLGTVCAIDKHPKYLTSSQVEALKTIAGQVSRLLELRKKNKDILQKATSLVTSQKKVAQMNMSEMETQNTHTAHVLREEINQALTAVRNYVYEARKDPALSKEYLEASVEELDNLTENVMQLSDSLAPAIFNAQNCEIPIRKIVEDFEKKENLQVRLQFTGAAGVFRREKGLLVCRVIQDLFRFASQSQSRSVGLTIQGDAGLELTFEYDTRKFIPENQKLMLQDNIMNRLEILGGQFEKWRYDSGETRIQISIPDAIG